MQRIKQVTAITLALLMIMMLTVAAAHAETSANKPVFLVRAVAIAGLKSVPEITVSDQIKKTVVGSEFNEDNIREDMKAIISTGLFKDVEARLAAHEDGVKVTFNLVENDIVKSIRIDTSVLDSVTLRGYIRQKEGQVLNERLLQEDLQQLRDRVIENHGYVLEPTDITLSKEGEMVIVLTAARVAKVVIEGNTETRDSVIRREIATKPGEYLNMSKLENDIRRIWHLGFFDEVKPLFFIGEKPDEIIVQIEVVERKTGMFSFGGGYSSADGFLGYLEFADENLLGRGESLSMRGEFAQKKVGYDLGFTEPYLFGTRTALGLSLYNTTSTRSKLETGEEVESDYIERRQGGDLSIGQPLGEFTKGSIKLKIEDTSIEPKAGSSLEASKSKTRSITLQTNTDTTVDPYYPVSGMRLNLGLELAGLYLGGDTPFSKYTAQHSRYFKVGSNNQVLAFQVVGGLGTSPNGKLPIQEEFRVGGAETLRGYKYGAMRGDRMVHMNSEYRFKLNKNLQAVFFVDGGQAWSGTGAPPEPLKWGYGAGLRINTPIGIMRLDYGIGENGGQTHFSLGPSF
jgi:outer membrane protein insertion porin family